MRASPVSRGPLQRATRPCRFVYVIASPRPASRRQYVDVATLSELPTNTGGEIRTWQDLTLSDWPALGSSWRRMLSREQVRLRGVVGSPCTLHGLYMCMFLSSTAPLQLPLAQASPGQHARPF